MKRAHVQIGRCIAAATVAWVLVLANAAHAGPKRVALLVGVGEYPAFGREGELEGSANDVVAMRRTLVKRLGVAESDIRTLVNQQATRNNILSELAALKGRSAQGDQIIVYMSGHGTSRLDLSRASTTALPYSTGAFLTYEYNDTKPQEGMIVGRTDLQPIIKDLEAAGRQLWVISDSCYSGQQARSMARAALGTDRLPGRFIPSKFAAVAGEAIQGSAGKRTPPDPYPYRNTIFFAAAAEGEIAVDVPERHLLKYPTLDKKPHGAFTDALIRVLEGDVFADFDGNGELDYAEVMAATQQFVSQRGYGHTPQKLPSVLEDSGQLASRQLIKVAGAAQTSLGAKTGPLRIAADGLPTELSQALKALTGVELVALNHPTPDLKLLSSDKNPNTMRILTPSGDAITTFDKSAPLSSAAGLFAQHAWAKRVRELGATGRRGLLKAEISPATYGGNFQVGDKIQFVVRPDKAAYLLLVNVDAQGKVSVLYPTRDEELAALPAGASAVIPSGPLEQAGIDVTEPLGMDMQMLFAFDQALPELKRLKGLLNVGADDARLRELEKVLSKANRAFTMANTELRVLPKP